MKKVLSLLFILFCTGTIYAQSADVITEILQSEEVSFGQVCYLSAVYQGLVSDDASYQEAIDALYDIHQIPERYYETTSVPMANLAFIYAQMWDVKGGLMFRITKGSPRYAFRQLKFDGIIADTIEPAKTVSGWEALNIYTNCDFKYGNQEISPADES